MTEGTGRLENKNILNSEIRRVKKVRNLTGLVWTTTMVTM